MPYLHMRRLEDMDETDPHVEYERVRLLDNGWVKVWNGGEDSNTADKAEPDIYPPEEVLSVSGNDSNIYYGNP